jgi:hypothetical protein
MNIKDRRERISDVMAVYIVAPTHENFRMIKADMEKRIFDNYYINFTSKCDDFQPFFSDIIKTDNYNRIYKIAVNPISFFLYHPQVFSLNIKDTYQMLNSPNVRDSEINTYFEQVGFGLFNVLFTLKTIPIIKYRTGWFAENIVEIIQNNFTQTFDKFPELKEEFPRKNNTLLLIVDRDTDLPIMLHHAPSLGSMINDIFGIVRSKSKEDKFEIDPLTDHIWNKYLSMNFLNAKENIKQDLIKVNEETKFLDQTNNNPDNIELISERISNTLEGLRDLTIRQEVLKKHVKFQEKLSKEIDNRSLGLIYEYEENLLSNRNITDKTKSAFFDIINLKTLKPIDINSSKNDILRLCLIYFLVNQKITNKEIEDIEKALMNIDPKLKDSFDYLKQKRNFEESLKRGNAEPESGFLQKSFSFFVNKVGSLITTGQSSIVADISNSVACNKEVNNFVTYNLLKKSLDKNQYNINQVIVFTVGGGSFAEYEYIDELLSKNSKNVKYF